MIQEILALTIVFGAIAYLAWSLYRVFVPGKEGAKSMCSGCPASQQGECAVKVPDNL